MKVLHLLSPFLFTLLCRASSIPVSSRQSPNNSTEAVENGLATDPCRALTVIFARGTSEPGNVGLIAGPPFFAALRRILGVEQVTVQGVDYAATWDGAFEGGDKAGSTLMAETTDIVSRKCPDTALVIAGYSQGAQLVHNAAKNFSATLSTRTSSVIVFGDPYISEDVGAIAAEKVDSFCHTRDIICNVANGMKADMSSHITCGADGESAARFVVERMKMAIGG